MGNLNQIIIGIDPGLAGAISVLNNREGAVPIRLYDMPIMPKKGKGNQVNGSDLAYLLNNIASERDHYSTDVNCFMEQVSAMPGNGSSSMFNFGCGYGVIQGVLFALKIPFRLVTPAKWKGYHKILKTEKDYARTLCIQQYPEMSNCFKRKKDIDRADALLIAAYGQHLLVKERG